MFDFLGQGTKVHILHTKADLASGFSQHILVPTWHILPLLLGVGSPLYKLSILVFLVPSLSSFSSLSVLMSLFSFSLHVPLW